jgi:hypothetical protein
MKEPIISVVYIENMGSFCQVYYLDSSRPNETGIIEIESKELEKKSKVFPKTQIATEIIKNRLYVRSSSKENYNAERFKLFSLLSASVLKYFIKR